MSATATLPSSEWMLERDFQEQIQDRVVSAARPAARVVSDLVIAGADRWVYRALVLAWIVANLIFWVWWLQPAHVATPWFFALFTVTFAYDAVFLPTMFLYFVGKMRRPRPLAAPHGLRVALITLCVPKEENPP